MELKTLETEFFKKLREMVSLMTYNSIFNEIRLHSYENNEVILAIPDNERLYGNITKNYTVTIEDILNDLTESTVNIKYVLEKDIPKLAKKEEKPRKKQERSLEENIDVDLDDEVSEYQTSSNFNPKYTFDTFVVGKSNELAYRTALQVAKYPSGPYNPYFLYSKSGLGKTHLMHAIGNYIIEHSDKKVLYITSEQFVNDYVSIVNIKNKNVDENISYLEAFRRKYRDVDVLMIDDIQFLEKATKSRTEFFHTFNELYNNQKQIIIASDRSVNDLKLLEDRLKTRFNGGLTESISPPENELKKNIILNKVKINDFDLDLNEEILDYMANNCGNDIRNLENSVLRLAAYKATFNLDYLTLNDAQDALEEYVTETVYKTNSITKIVDIVAKYYGLDMATIKGKMRKKNIAQARAIAMYLSCYMTDESLERIGLEIGGKNHATVIHNRDKINEEIKTNNQLKEEIKILKDKICE